MRLMSFADAEHASKRKQTRKELIEMGQIVAMERGGGADFALLKGEDGRPVYPLIAMLRVSLM